ncbi:MAG: lytic murein transglycosylase B [Proteobacteria bacterium]|nr:lytic murein transglycosylase B [Pseudomonadota bacterium]
MKLIKVLFFLGLFFLKTIYAANVQPILPAPLTENQFIEKMVKEYHFDQKELTLLLGQAEVLPEVIERCNKPFEEKPWDFYRNFFITPDRVQGGVVFWHEHADTLEKVSKAYGIPPEIIVAITGIETKYGQQTSKFPALSTLKTLAFHYPKRAAFFQNELENFLLLTRENHLSPNSLMGSYAGALGIPQFMPSTYRKYAISFDKAHSVNLLTDKDDAIASIAYYLQQSGWQPNQPVATPALIDQPMPTDLLVAGAKPIYNQTFLIQHGVHSKVPLINPPPACLIALHNTHGEEYWLSYPNFYAIMTYNPRTTYAMAIYQLSEQIRQAYEGSIQTSTGTPTTR